MRSSILTLLFISTMMLTVKVIAGPEELTPTWILPLAPAGYGGPGVINPYSNVNPLNPMAAEMQARAAHSSTTQSPQQELGPANTASTTTKAFLETEAKVETGMKKAVILEGMKIPSYIKNLVEQNKEQDLPYINQLHSDPPASQSNQEGQAEADLKPVGLIDNNSPDHVYAEVVDSLPAKSKKWTPDSVYEAKNKPVVANQCTGCHYL